MPADRSYFFFNLLIVRQTDITKDRVGTFFPGEVISGNNRGNNRPEEISGRNSKNYFNSLKLSLRGDTGVQKGGVGGNLEKKCFGKKNVFKK